MTAYARPSVTIPDAANNGKWLRTVSGAFAWVAVAAADVTGLGTSATRNVGTTAGTVAAGDDPRLLATSDIDGGTASAVGAGSVDGGSA